MKVSEIGEFGLIARLAEKLGAPASDRLLVGIGDDAAVWRAGDAVLIATTDTMVEDVHFLPHPDRWRDTGWKALAVNVSDVAAMGGRPAFALVTLALPPEVAVEALDDLYEGLRDCARAYGVAIAGGDVVRAPQVSVTVALMGEALVVGGEPLLLRRSAAQPGDVVAVTGALGAAAAGLRRLRDGAGAGDPLVRAHLRPQPRVEAGLAAIEAGVRCGIDVSDGLLQDVGHICELSGVSATLRAADIPLAEGLASVFPKDALQLACTGGEDYELVFAATADRIAALANASSVHVTAVGEITERGRQLVTVVDKDGAPVDLGDGGWDHMR